MNQLLVSYFKTFKAKCKGKIIYFHRLHWSLSSWSFFWRYWWQWCWILSALQTTTLLSLDSDWISLKPTKLPPRNSDILLDTNVDSSFTGATGEVVLHNKEFYKGDEQTMTFGVYNICPKIEKEHPASPEQKPMSHLNKNSAKLQRIYSEDAVARTNV